MVTVSVFFDFSKAFDKMDHFFVLRWIHSYLTERTQAIKDCIEGTTSSSSPVRAGMPQDSVLVPLLFTLYLTDFGHVIKHCKYNFYADDLQAYIHCEPRDLSDIRKVNENIDAILGLREICYFCHNVELNYINDLLNSHRLGFRMVSQSIRSATTLADFKQKLYSQLLVCVIFMIGI
ncbi:hypothetical protein ACFW04_011835 [Cataglyphis niger]